MPASPPIVLRRDVRDAAVAMARASLPREVCALVSGPRLARWEGPEPIVVSAILRVRNSSTDNTRFAMDGQAMIDAESRILGQNEEVIGVLHSHPVSAGVPSETDVRDAGVYDPSGLYVHLIVSLQGFAPDVRAWRYGSVAERASGALPMELDVMLGDVDLRSP